MKVLADYPAVLIGLAVTVALLVLNLIGGEDWSAESVIEVAAPLLTGLAIHTQVVPNRKAAAGDVPKQPAGTTYRTEGERKRT